MEVIIVGVAVFVISQYFLKLIIEPILEFKKIISQICFHLDYYLAHYTNVTTFYSKGKRRDDLSEQANQEFDNMRKECKSLALKLRTHVETIVFFDIITNFFSPIFNIPKKENVENAITTLIQINNMSSFDLQEFNPTPGKNPNIQMRDKIDNVKRYLKSSKKENL